MGKGRSLPHGGRRRRKERGRGDILIETTRSKKDLRGGKKLPPSNQKKKLREGRGKRDPFLTRERKLSYCGGKILWPRLIRREVEIAEIKCSFSRGMRHDLERKGEKKTHVSHLVGAKKIPVIGTGGFHSASKRTGTWESYNKYHSAERGRA